MHVSLLSAAMTFLPMAGVAHSTPLTIPLLWGITAGFGAGWLRSRWVDVPAAPSNAYAKAKRRRPEP